MLELLLQQKIPFHFNHKLVKLHNLLKYIENMDSPEQTSHDEDKEKDTERLNELEERISSLLESLATLWNQVDHDLSESALVATKAYNALENSTQHPAALMISYLKTLDLNVVPSYDEVGRAYLYSWQLCLSKSLVLTHSHFPRQPTPGFGLVLAPVVAGMSEAEVVDSGKEDICTCGARPNLYWWRGPSVVVCNICRKAHSDFHTQQLQWPMHPDVRQTQELKDKMKPPRIVIVLECDWTLANN